MLSLFPKAKPQLLKAKYHLPASPASKALLEPLSMVNTVYIQKLVISNLTPFGICQDRVTYVRYLLLRTLSLHCFQVPS